MASAVALAAAPVDLPNTGPDTEWRDIARAALQSHRERMQADFSAGVDIARLLGQWCAVIDAVVASAWLRTVAEQQSRPKAAATLALLATGGYGRGEMYPHSDIDLLIVANKRQQKQYSGSLSSFYALLWDCGLASSHAVRSIDECQQAAKEDITVLTALMELRLLAGQDVMADLNKQLSTKHLWSAKGYFAARNLLHQSVDVQSDYGIGERSKARRSGGDRFQRR